jgi:hypothetical protein
MEAPPAANGAALSGARNEAFASLLAFEALGTINGGAACQFEKARECGSFLTDLGRAQPVDLRDGGTRFLVQLYLPRMYGADINRRFLHEWPRLRALWRRLSEEQAFAASYSLICGRNLGDAFQLIGYNVTPALIDHALLLAPRG